MRCRALEVRQQGLSELDKHIRAIGTDTTLSSVPSAERLDTDLTVTSVIKQQKAL